MITFHVKSPLPPTRLPRALILKKKCVWLIVWEMCGLNKHLFSLFKADCTQISVKKIQSYDTEGDENRSHNKKQTNLCRTSGRCWINKYIKYACVHLCVCMLQSMQSIQKNTLYTMHILFKKQWCTLKLNEPFHHTVYRSQVWFFN